MLFTTAVALFAAIMAPAVNAHMIMANPVPYGNVDGKPDNSPLSPSGSDYPCKIAAVPAGAKMNELKAGEKSTLSISGGAAHEGGSCQLSVTLDKAPTKESKFKVIHSIEGGCPSTSSGGGDFAFDVPKELPNGEAVFAWTWFNKVGNREMYMNCAKITVSGGASDNKEFESLPDMALANIQVGDGAKCTTPAGKDFTFENPGKYVTKASTAGDLVSLCGGEASGGGTSPGQAAPGSGAAPVPNNGQYSQPAASQAPAAPSEAPAVSSQALAAPPPAPAATSVPAAPLQSGALTSTIRTLITVTASSGIAAPTSNATSAAPTASAMPSQGVSAPAPGTSTGGTACTTDGQVICNGETQWGLCNHGKVEFQAVAAGTKCKEGQIAKRDYAHRAQRSAL